MKKKYASIDGAAAKNGQNSRSVLEAYMDINASLISITRYPTSTGIELRCCAPCFFLILLCAVCWVRSRGADVRSCNGYEPDADWGHLTSLYIVRRSPRVSLVS